MKQILLQGYGLSGVSFLRDFFKELDDSFVFDEEFDLLRKSGGIIELETVFSLNNPFLDDCSIRRFKNFYEYLNEKRNWKDILGENFLELSNALFQQLVLYKLDWEDKGYQVQESLKFPKDKYGFHKKFTEETRELNEDKNIYFLQTQTEEKIINLLTKYMENVLNCFPKSKYLCLVHPLQISSKIDNQLKYFSHDAKIIKIQRDPRDVFINNPHHNNNIQYFIDGFKKWRLYDDYNEKILRNRILTVQFEDFVLNYEKVRNEILDFCGINISEHHSPKKFSNPELSKKNVGLYKTVANQEHIKIIEHELAQYLYTVPLL